MEGNFDKEAIILIILTYTSLIIVILRIALALCRVTITNEIDRAKQMSDESLSLQKVTIVKADENKQNLNRNHSSFTSKNKCKQHERPIK
uniref:Secreted protein n=1 Tax=Loa loa TaxID=7209 RepID=A0A1I7VL62_LOALO